MPVQDPNVLSPPLRSGVHAAHRRRSHRPYALARL